MIESNKSAHLTIGKNAEQRALQYLEKQGLILLQKNYRCKQGEIDLIMQDKSTLVFIEVRYRKNDIYGSALESITKSKQSRIIAACYHYLAKYKNNRPMRLDVVAISGDQSLNWIKNAFQA